MRLLAALVGVHGDDDRSDTQALRLERAAQLVLVRLDPLLASADSARSMAVTVPWATRSNTVTWPRCSGCNCTRASPTPWRQAN